MSFSIFAFTLFKIFCRQTKHFNYIKTDLQAFHSRTWQNSPVQSKSPKPHTLKWHKQLFGRYHHYRYSRCHQLVHWDKFLCEFVCLKITKLGTTAEDDFLFCIVDFKIYRFRRLQDRPKTLPIDPRLDKMREYKVATLWLVPDMIDHRGTLETFNKQRLIINYFSFFFFNIYLAR